MIFQFNQWREQQSGGLAGDRWQHSTGSSELSFSGHKMSTSWRLEPCPRARGRSLFTNSPSPIDCYSWFPSQVRLLALKVSVACLPSSVPWGMKMPEYINDAASCATTTEKKPARLTKVPVATESSGDEFGILEEERCIDTGVFQNCHLLHE